MEVYRLSQFMTRRRAQGQLCPSCIFISRVNEPVGWTVHKIFSLRCSSFPLCLNIYIYIYTHTYTYIHTYFKQHRQHNCFCEMATRTVCTKWLLVSACSSSYRQAYHTLRTAGKNFTFDPDRCKTFTRCS